MWTHYRPFYTFAPNFSVILSFARCERCERVYSFYILSFETKIKNLIGWFMVTWFQINAMFPFGQQVKNYYLLPQVMKHPLNIHLNGYYPHFSIENTRYYPRQTIVWAAWAWALRILLSDQPIRMLCLFHKSGKRRSAILKAFVNIQKISRANENMWWSNNYSWKFL